MAGGGGKAKPLEFTPTWIVASVCSVIVVISLLFERLLHRLGKRLKKSTKKPLYEALLKVKEELMLLGFISLLLSVLQGPLGEVCVRQSAMRVMLPCKQPPQQPRKTEHLGDAVFTGFMGGARRLLAGGGVSEDYCLKKRSFFKQIYGSVTEEDYTTMRLGFIMKHCRANPKFNFYDYMIRALEVDFKKVVGISWYLWTMLMLFLLLNVPGWYVYIWTSLVTFILLLLVGSKMEHIITELAYEVAQKDTTIEGELVVAPSDDFYWFHRPKLVLVLLHIILFQNAFEVAFFFWLLVTYGFKSCIMGKPSYIITRVVISVVSQFLCGYSTLPLYAIVSHMGNSFKKSIFDENVTEGLVNWAEDARRRRKIPKRTTIDANSSPIDDVEGGTFQMTNILSKSSVEQGTARLI